MRAYSCFADNRNKDLCIHCGGPYETDDHIPSKILLDEPYPDNLMVCPACRGCNSALAIDEDYLACLLECVLVGDTDPSKIQRSKIATILTRSEPLRKRLQAARTERTEGPSWAVEHHRVMAVLKKLARGHAAYEYNEIRFDEPQIATYEPMVAMSNKERGAFEYDIDQVAPAAWPEVGSRAMQRMLVVDAYCEAWVVVQDGNYRFRVTQDDGLTVKIVLREYLGCRFVWS
jgi:hypothetical protein